MEEKEVWDDPGTMYFKVIILLNRSNDPRKACSFVPTFTFHMRKLEHRKIPYLGFLVSDEGGLELRTKAGVLSITSQGPQERDSFSLHEPKEERKGEVTQRQNWSPEEEELPRIMCAA